MAGGDTRGLAHPPTEFDGKPAFLTFDYDGGGFPLACRDFAGYHGIVMRQWAFGLLGIALVLCSTPAPAVQCALDQVPAATLLVPYFEVDLASVNQQTTLLFVTNMTSAAALAHATIWTDWGVPALGFDVYLTGYDVQLVNLRDVIANGNLPQTASLGQDPGDIISPDGPRSQDINYSSRNGVLPPAMLGTAARAELQAELKGEPLPSNPTLCAGSPRGNPVARGYVTGVTPLYGAPRAQGWVGFMTEATNRFVASIPATSFPVSWTP